jgi:hypothetical protein
MAQKYFRYIPNFDYVDRTINGKNISDYTLVKNLFKRAKIREDIFADLTFFTKYKVNDNDRPDNVAFEVYQDENLDWLVLLSNNIVNYETEWPMTQIAINNYLLRKYGSFDEIYSTRYFETNEVKNSNGNVIVRKGFEVPEDYSITFFDPGINQIITSSSVFPVSNYDFEIRIEDQKRNIFLIKPEFIGLIIDDLTNIMKYIKGSSQYVSDTVVRGENILLFQ